jgi:hypothetical protein
MRARDFLNEQPFVPVNRGFTYKGYPCTKDCSGHMAGDAWAEKKGITSANQCPPGWSNSFWEGCKSNSEYTAEETELSEELSVDVPNEEWLQGKIDYAKSRPRNSYGVPYMGTGTAYARRVMLPVNLLKHLPGMRDEQNNVRQDDLQAIMKIMKDTGKLPLTRSGQEYEPFVNVAYNGEAWVNEGNHRIMAAAALGWDSLPVELRYFDGGERIESGPLYPKKIGLGDQELDEMAGEIHGGVRKALMDKGYKYLGSGIDKQAYLEPGTGQVLIVFGYRKGQKDFSPDQRMFINWINYCNKNQSNPHLPKFTGFESFKFQGKNYIQARMEPLQELPDEIGYLVQHIDEVIKKQKKDYSKELQTIAQYAMHTFNDEGGGMWYELKDAVKHLGGKKAAANLLNTVYDVKRFGRKQGYTIDLHKGNYMQRTDGTIVVNDPFVLWLKGMLD